MSVPYVEWKIITAYLDTKRPIIEEANAIAPTFSHIYKDMIIFVPPNKPFPRAGKGTIMRKAALVAYAPEIESL